MAVNPNTTNLAVDKQIAGVVRGMAKKEDMTVLNLTNQLLTFALKQSELKVQVEVKTLKPKWSPKALPSE